MDFCGWLGILWRSCFSARSIHLVGRNKQELATELVEWSGTDNLMEARVVSQAYPGGGCPGYPTIIVYGGVILGGCPGGIPGGVSQGPPGGIPRGSWGVPPWGIFRGYPGDALGGILGEFPGAFPGSPKLRGRLSIIFRYSPILKAGVPREPVPTREPPLNPPPE